MATSEGGLMSSNSSQPAIALATILTELGFTPAGLRGAERLRLGVRRLSSLRVPLPSGVAQQEACFLTDGRFCVVGQCHANAIEATTSAARDARMITGRADRQRATTRLLLLPKL